MRRIQREAVNKAEKRCETRQPARLARSGVGILQFSGVLGLMAYTIPRSSFSLSVFSD